ncbi:EAL domain-containing protein [Rhodoferax sp. PAMC 29310]|uniref:EAL domain-containing protein n=1 Tax=Rhodoferax sp. PAMC 29310 TaxID=2822760 RepID=UPI001B33BA7D|nr:EAL domain-containing protein [Rhodoferax sp. PAMC 29310]
MSEKPLPPKLLLRDANTHRSPISPALSLTFLRFSIAALLVGAAIAVLVLRVVLPQQPERVWGAIGVAAIALVAWLIQYRGHWRHAMRFLAIGAWSAVTVIAVFTGGVMSPVVIAYPLIILMTGWLLSPLSAVITAGLTVVATVGLIAAEQWGWLARAYAIPLVWHGVDQIIVYIMAALIAFFVVRVYQNRIDESREAAAALIQRTADMEAGKLDLQRAQGVARVGSWGYELGTDIMRFSDEACRILGLREGTVLNQATCLAGVYSLDRDAMGEAWLSAVKSGHFDHEHRVQVGRDIRWVREKAEISYSPDGTPLKAVGVTQDITVRRLAEEGLRESEARYRSLVEFTPQPILVHRMGTLLFVNEAAIKLFGARDAAQLMTHQAQDLIHPDSQVSQRARMERINSDMPVTGMVEARFLRLDGRTIDVEVQGTAIVYQGERAIQVAIHDITEMKAHQKQLEHIAHFDALTGLPNRVLLADRLHQGMVQAQRRGTLLAVAYLDLDGFKAINDRYGHQTGDQLLIALAARMGQTQREGDTLARLGGDEFVAVLLDLDNADACLPMLTRLLSAAAKPVQLNGQTLQVSASLGVTFFPQSEGVDADQLLRQADQAMYQAKLAGKNRHHVFDTVLDRHVRGHHQSLERIRRALVDSEFVLHYQPKVNMRTGQVIGVEALIRWQHPEDGLLAPAAFLPVIENHALAVEVGEWVLATALEQVKQWQFQGLTLPVSVNVSAYQLQQPDFSLRLRAVQDACIDLPPDCLQLEVLETSAMTDMAHVSTVMSECRRYGVTFALDDFGTGYSSLTYLKHLPVSQLKIDQSFVRNMLDDPDDLAILEGIIGLASTFRREVIAEGVETVEHGVMLLQLGCHLAQGNGIAPAMPGSEIEGWLRRWQPAPAWRDQVLIRPQDLPLLIAGVEHRAWLGAVERYIKGERLEPPPLGPTECRLGGWLVGDGLVHHGSRPGFESVSPLHDRVHVVAGRLCELKSSGEGEQACARLGELQGPSQSLLAQLSALTES